MKNTIHIAVLIALITIIFCLSFALGLCVADERKPNTPIDIELPMMTEPVDDPVPLFEGMATRYDYKINNIRWSKSHNTCALRIKERHKKYKVCSIQTEKCVICYHNDYGPAEYTNKVIDLSSHAFKELGIPLSRGVAEVKIYFNNE